MAALLAGLLPEGACWAGAGEEDIDEAETSLSASERAAILASVPARRREFALGRLCARRALRQLGASAEVGVGPRREPSWPPGIVGAITHQDGVAVAALAKATNLDGLGIDLAHHAPLPEGVLDQVANAGERAWIEGDLGPLHWGTVVFSAKESLYKAISRTVGRVVDFHEATLDRAGEELRVCGAVAGVRGERLTLRYGVSDSWVVTTAALAPAAAAVPGSRLAGPRKLE